MGAYKRGVGRTNYETISNGMGFETFRVRPPSRPNLPSHVPVHLLRAPPFPPDYITDVRPDTCPLWIDRPKPMRSRDDRDPQLDPFPRPVFV